jgi:hypothetical protein
MAELKIKLGTSTAFTLTLASLANGAGRAATAIDNSSTNAMSADIYLKIKTGASGTLTTGYLDIYLIRSEDGTTYDDNFAGTNAAFTPINATKIGIISAVANATTYVAVINTQLIGDLPRKFSIGVVNNTGGALDSTEGNHAYRYTFKTVQSS